ncbi:MAG: phage antirepressor N-terminal domain-containing protein, partial [Macromonas sp.]
MSQNQIVSVSFHNETVFAIIVDGKPLVPMTPICKNLGLDWEPQRKRIQRHPVLKTSTSMMEVQMPGDDQIRQVTCLPLSMLNGWLFGVDVNRVKAALRDKLMDYQRECFDVLFQHFMPRMEAAMQASANDYTRI